MEASIQPMEERRYRRWSAEEVQQLRHLFPTVGLTGLARELGRSKHGVKQMARALGLKKPAPGRSWTEAEVALLRRLFPSLGAEETAQALGRTRTSVMAMAYSLGLRQTCRDRRLPVGTERMVAGRLLRKVSVEKSFRENWRPVCAIEESPELRELYRLLQQIRRRSEELIKSQVSPSSVRTC